jgi:hypothetical protein
MALIGGSSPPVASSRPVIKADICFRSPLIEVALLGP